MDQILASLLAGGIEKAVAWVVSVGGFAAAVPLLLEALKRSDKFPFLTPYTDTINRVVSVIAAVFTANAVSYAYDGVTGDLVFHGLTALTLAKLLIAIATQFGLQEVFYRFVVKAMVRR